MDSTVSQSMELDLMGDWPLGLRGKFHQIVFYINLGSGYSVFRDVSLGQLAALEQLLECRIGSSLREKRLTKRRLHGSKAEDDRRE